MWTIEPGHSNSSARFGQDHFIRHKFSLCHCEKPICNEAISLPKLRLLRCARNDMHMDSTREKKLCYYCTNIPVKAYPPFMAALEQAAERLDFKRILPILVIVLVDLMGLSIIIPLLPLFAVRFGATPFIIGFLRATYPMLQLIVMPIFGLLSD